MKKIISLLLAVLLLLSLTACGRGEEVSPSTEEATLPETTQPATEPPTESVPEETTEPAPTEPQWQPGISLVSYAPALFRTLAAGEAVTVIGEFGDYYVIAGEEADLLIDKTFLRLASEEPFEAFTGYLRWNTVVYPDAYMRGSDVLTPPVNTKVTVEEGKDNWLYIRWDGGSGFVSAEQVSSYPVSTGGGSGSGGGGGSDGGDVPMGSLSARPGTPGISLLSAYHGPTFTPMEPTQAVALVADTQAYLTLLCRDAQVKVVEANETACRVYFDGLYAELPRYLLRLEGDPAYEAWTGYTKYGAVQYEEYLLRNALASQSVNTQVLVLDEVAGVYVVEINGTVGYMTLDQVSQYRSNTGGGGGSGGGGGGGDWTPPAM